MKDNTPTRSPIAAMQALPAAIKAENDDYSLTQDSVQAARERMAGNYQACIDAAKAGEFFVNDLPSYIEQCERDCQQVLAGERDHTFAFWQLAFWIQTGKCVPLLPSPALVGADPGDTK